MDSSNVLLRCGLTGVIFWNCEVGDRPLLGAYYTPENEGQWVAMAWTADGFHINNENPSNLDIVENLDGAKEATKAAQL